MARRQKVWDSNPLGSKQMESTVARLTFVAAVTHVKKILEKVEVRSVGERRQILAEARWCV